MYRPWAQVMFEGAVMFAGEVVFKVAAAVPAMATVAARSPRILIDL